jgi:hypothetical protein
MATTEAYLEVPQPLAGLLYEAAEEGADDELSSEGRDVWAALFRDGADAADRLSEALQELGDSPRSEDDDTWRALRDAAGVIVIRDNRRGRVEARVYADEEDLLSAWDAIKVEEEPTAVDVESSELDDSTVGPSEGPEPGPDSEA